MVLHHDEVATLNRTAHDRSQAMNKDYPYRLIDAYTETPMGGNPCAVFFDADDLDGETRLKIAREMNLSETAFVCRTDCADFGVRYYTLSGEIPLAGHPTVATITALIADGRLPLDETVTDVTLEMGAGVVPIRVTREEFGPPFVTMTQMPPQFGKTFDPSAIMPLFGLRTEDAMPGVPIQIVSTGTPQLLVPAKDLSVLRRMNFNMASFAEFSRTNGLVSGPHLFCTEGATAEGRTFARHPCSPPNPNEDPFTGSSTGGMACLLWRHEAIEESSFVAEQGHWMGRPGKAWVEIVGPPGEPQMVKVSGQGVVLIEGTFSL